MHWHGGSLSPAVILLPYKKPRLVSSINSSSSVFLIYHLVWGPGVLVFSLILMVCMQSATGIGSKLLHHPYGWDQRSQHYWQRSKKGKIWQPVKTSVSPVWERCAFHSQPDTSDFGLPKSKTVQIQIVTLKSQLAGKQHGVWCQEMTCNTAFLRQAQYQKCSSRHSDRRL